MRYDWEEKYVTFHIFGPWTHDVVCLRVEYVVLE